jgi:hypothetical protein
MRQYRVSHYTTHDTARSDQRIKGFPNPKTVRPFGSKNKLGGWGYGLVGVKRPPLSVKIEIGFHSSEIHVGVPVGIQVSHITPIGRIPGMGFQSQLPFAIRHGHVDIVLDFILLPVGIGIDPVGVQEIRYDFAAEVDFISGCENFNQSLRPEKVNSHGGQHVAGVSRYSFGGLSGFFLKTKNAKFFVHFGHTELMCQFCSHLEERNGNICRSLLVVAGKQAVVHFVNVVT